MSLPRLAVRRPITTAMLLASVLLFGVLAIGRLPLAYIPEVDVPFIFVDLPYPDSNPVQVEREIVQPVEEVLGTLSGIKSLRTTATADGAEVRLEFLWGESLDVVRMRVAEAMDRVEGRLPEGVGPVRVFTFDTGDIPVVEGRISAEGVDLSENYELLETRVAARLQRLPGVARVELGGVEPREVFIDLRLDDLRRHGVDVDRLIETLRGASQATVLGPIDDDGRRYAARAVADVGSLEQLAALPIGPRGLRLEDIADVTYEEPPLSFGRRLDHQPAIALEVYKESTANTVETVHAVLAALEGEIESDPLLEGINIFLWGNQADEITGALDGLTRSGLYGALLAILVLYVFLRRLGTTLIVSLTIPFSVIAACGMLYFLGKTLNILSMTGLMLGVGMLVDNAIVVLESIDRERRKQPDPKRAALDGARLVATAVLASTLTSLIVFLPLIVGSQAEITVWLGEMGMAIALSLVCSLFSSLTLIPLVASRFLARGEAPRPPRFIVWLEARYAAFLRGSMARRRTTWLAFAGVLAVGFAPFFLGMVETAMFSGGVNERIYLEYDFKDFVYKSEASAAALEVEQAVEAERDRWPIESIYSYFGSGSAGTTFTLARRDLDDEEVAALRAEIREVLPTIPGVELRFDEDEDDGGVDSFAVKLFGQDSATLEQLAAQVAARLEGVDGVADLRTSLGEPRREIEVEVDRPLAARLGLSAQDVTQSLNFVLGGLRLPRTQIDGKEVDTWMALRLEDRTDLADLKQISFREVEGRPVLLGDIATFRTVDRPIAIERQDRRVMASVRALYEGDDWDTAQAEIEARMNAFALPPGTSWSWNDRILEQADQDQQMAINMLLALALVYLVMASLFESLAQPFAILLAIPFALPGAAWLLALTDTPFNLMAQIGLLILMGIVVNNGIVLLDHANQLRAGGLDRETALVEAGRDRLRAILMTASTTIIGLLPLAAGGSRLGGLFYYPLALTVIGGLVSSVVLTLGVLPHVDLLLARTVGAGGRLWRASAPGSSAAGSSAAGAPAAGSSATESAAEPA